MPDPQVTLHVLHCDQGDILQSTGQASTHSSSRYSGQSNTQLVKRGIYAFPWQLGGILQSTEQASTHSSSRYSGQSNTQLVKKGIHFHGNKGGILQSTGKARRHSFSQYAGQSNTQLVKRGMHFHANQGNSSLYALLFSVPWTTNKQLVERGMCALPWQPGKGGGILRSTGQASTHSSR